MASDAYCPACAGAVSVTTTACPHCTRPLDAPLVLDGGTGDAGDRPSAELTSWERRLDTWLSPDGWSEASLTNVIAIAAGLCIGPLVVGFLGIVTENVPLAVLTGVLAWLGATVGLARHRSVYDAVHNGGLAVAGMLVIFPLSVLVSWDGSTFNRFVGFLAFELVLGAVAVSVFFVAKIAGQIQKKSQL